MMAFELDTKPRRTWVDSLAGGVKWLLMILGAIALIALVSVPFVLGSDQAPQRDAFWNVAERICGPLSAISDTPPPPGHTEQFFNCLTQRLLASEGK